MKLHAVTTYYNPAGYASRRANYDTFRDRMIRQGMPLLTVEGVSGNIPQLISAGEMIHRVPIPSPMWLKENLTNVGVASALPDDVDAVVTVDCDFLFTNGWIETLAKLMETHAAVQCFNSVVHLRQGETEYAEGREIVPGKAAAMAAGRTQWGAPGGAWCIHIDLLDQFGLYDRCITGSGDMPLASAALGAEYPNMPFHMSPKMVPDCRAWMDGFSSAAKLAGGGTFLPVPALHLWHGNRVDRKYMDRHHILTDFDFDPQKDVKADANGVFRWNSPKVGLHQAMAEYFKERNEDAAYRLPTASGQPQWTKPGTRTPRKAERAAPTPTPPRIAPIATAAIPSKATPPDPACPRCGGTLFGNCRKTCVKCGFTENCGG